MLYNVGFWIVAAVTSSTRFASAQSSSNWFTLHDPTTPHYISHSQPNGGRHWAMVAWLTPSMQSNVHLGATSFADVFAVNRSASWISMHSTDWRTSMTGTYANVCQLETEMRLMHTKSRKHPFNIKQRTAPILSEIACPVCEFSSYFLTIPCT